MSQYPRDLPLLLIALGQAGIELSLHPSEPAKLRFRPLSMSAAYLEPLRTHRAAVVGLLVIGHPPELPGEQSAGYIYEERLGIADELGMPTHPGSPAWLVAVGEAIGASNNDT